MQLNCMLVLTIPSMTGTIAGDSSMATAMHGPLLMMVGASFASASSVVTDSYLTGSSANTCSIRCFIESEVSITSAYV